MNKLTTSKRIWSIFLTLAMVLTMSVTALPSYAAGSGTATVTYKPATEGLVTETFSLYKVGHFESKDGKSYLALDEGMPDGIDVSISKDDYTDEEGNVDIEAWTAAWQTSAAALEAKIDSTGVTPAEATTGTDGVAVFTGLEDGLYLLTGPMQEYMDTETGVNTYFKPAASFIMVLNGKAELEVKYDEKSVREYVIKKVWEDTGHEALRPASVDVKLSYRDSSSTDAEWVEEKTVTLDADNKWTYEWDSEPKYEWKWEELMNDSDAIHYIVSSSEVMGQTTDEHGTQVDTDDNKKYVTLTNTYTKRKLEITKILDSFLQNGGNGATFAFEIRGYMGSEETGDLRLVYTGSAGINFKDKAGKLVGDVDNIPVNLTKLEVDEVYDGDYEVVTKVQTAVLNEETGVYTVSFENKWKDDTTISGGIVNTYTNKEGKIVLSDKDKGKTPTAVTATPEAE